MPADLCYLSLAHLTVGPAKEELHPPLWLALALAATGGVLPFLAGLWTGWRGKPWPHQGPCVLGGAAGVLVFLLIDFANLTASLGMGLGDVAFRLGLLGAVVAGAGLPAWLEARGLDRVVIWSAGIGLHALGEGLILGYNLHQGLGVVLRLGPLLSFALHKAAEGWTAGLLPAPTGRRRLATWCCGLVGAPALVGALAGYAGAPGTVANLAYAAGLGSVLWVLPHFLARPAGTARLKATAGLLLGLMAMYGVAALHEL